jgi:HlyD family secretion protein
VRAPITILLLVAAAAAGAAAGYFGHDWLNPTGSGPPPQSAVERGEVKARGRLEPESELIAVGLPAGSRVESLCVQEGDPVHKDAVLAYLDTYDEMLAARDSARVQLDEARKRLEAEKAFGVASVDAAGLRKRQTEEVSPLAIQAQEAEVDRSKAELAKAELDLKRSQQMYSDQSVPKSHLDAASLVREQARDQLVRNQATLAQLNLDYQIKLKLADADLKSAEAGSTRAQLAAQVDSLAAALKLAESRLRRAEIRAPIDGKIIKILTHAGEAAGRDPLLKMGDTSTMYAVAEVYETDVWRVHKGQKATVTSKAFPPDPASPDGDRQKLTGTVDRVASLVRKNDVLSIDPTEDADTRVVAVRIKLENSSFAARFNQLQVEVTIEAEK